MSRELESLILDLLEWVGSRPRTYAEVMDAWRTSCPRLPVWEEANDRGLVTRRSPTDAGDAAIVTLTPAGRSLLATRS